MDIKKSIEWREMCEKQRLPSDSKFQDIPRYLDHVIKVNIKFIT